MLGSRSSSPGPLHVLSHFIGEMSRLREGKRLSQVTRPTRSWSGSPVLLPAHLLRGGALDLVLNVSKLLYKCKITGGCKELSLRVYYWV